MISTRLHYTPKPLAACWITNPLTALPIYLATRRFGKYVVDYFKIVEVTMGLFGFERQTGRAGMFMKHTLYLWTGTLVFSIVSALWGNALIRLAWPLTRQCKGPTSRRHIH